MGIFDSWHGKDKKQVVAAMLLLAIGCIVLIPAVVIWMDSAKAARTSDVDLLRGGLQRGLTLLIKSETYENKIHDKYGAEGWHHISETDLRYWLDEIAQHTECGQLWITDPWRHECRFYITCTHQDYPLVVGVWSPGPDGRFHTDDDIVMPAFAEEVLKQVPLRESAHIEHEPQ